MQQVQSSEMIGSSSYLKLRRIGPARMFSCTLRKYENTHENDRCDDCSRQRTADLQTAFRDRLVEQIAKRCAERARQDERCPEQQHTRNARPEMENGDDREAASEDESTNLVTEAHAGRNVV